MPFLGHLQPNRIYKLHEWYKSQGDIKRWISKECIMPWDSACYVVHDTKYETDHNFWGLYQ